MPVNPLASQANHPCAETVRRLLCTSRTYLGLQAAHRHSRAQGSEFVDPPRYRCAPLRANRRAAA